MAQVKSHENLPLKPNRQPMDYYLDFPYPHESSCLGLDMCGAGEDMTYQSITRYKSDMRKLDQCLKKRRELAIKKRNERSGRKFVKKMLESK